MKLFQLFRKAAAVKCVSDVLELLLYNRKNRMVCRNTSWKNQTSVLQWLDKLSLNRIVKGEQSSSGWKTTAYSMETSFERARMLCSSPGLIK